MVDEKYQSRGYGTQALALLLKIIRQDSSRHCAVPRLYIRKALPPSGSTSAPALRSQGQVFGSEHIMKRKY